MKSFISLAVERDASWPMITSARCSTTATHRRPSRSDSAPTKDNSRGTQKVSRDEPDPAVYAADVSA